MWETILWVMDNYPVYFWCAVTGLTGAVVLWGSLTWEACKLVDELDKEGGLH